MRSNQHPPMNVTCDKNDKHRQSVLKQAQKDPFWKGDVQHMQQQFCNTSLSHGPSSCRALGEI